MTTSMIFWSIVAILALIGLVWLFARDWKRAKPVDYAATGNAVADNLAVKSVSQRVEEAEAATEGVNQAIASVADGDAGFVFKLEDGRITGLIPAGEFRTDHADANPAEAMREDAKPDRRPKFEVYRDKRNGYRWRLLSANGRTLCSGESHTRARDAARAARTVIETAAIADVVHASRSGN